MLYLQCRQTVLKKRSYLIHLCTVENIFLFMHIGRKFPCVITKGRRRGEHFISCITICKHKREEIVWRITISE